MAILPRRQAPHLAPQRSGVQYAVAACNFVGGGRSRGKNRRFRGKNPRDSSGKNPLRLQCAVEKIQGIPEWKKSNPIAMP